MTRAQRDALSSMSYMHLLHIILWQLIFSKPKAFNIQDSNSIDPNLNLTQSIFEEYESGEGKEGITFIEADPENVFARPRLAFPCNEMPEICVRSISLPLLLSKLNDTTAQYNICYAIICELLFVYYYWSLTRDVNQAKTVPLHSLSRELGVQIREEMQGAAQVTTVL